MSIIYCTKFNKVCKFGSCKYGAEITNMKYYEDGHELTLDEIFEHLFNEETSFVELKNLAWCIDTKNAVYVGDDKLALVIGEKCEYFEEKLK